MRNKKLFLPKAIIFLGIVFTIVTSLIVSIAKKPTITEYTFPISITYEFDGKTETITDEYICTYTGPGQSIDPKDRFYDGYLKNRDSMDLHGDYLIKSYEDGKLAIYTNLSAGYLMGDPNYTNYYTEYNPFEPYVAYYVYEDYMEYDDAEHLAPLNVKIVDWEYPQPIENTLVFSNITRLTVDNILPTLVVSLLTLIVCVIFVKKDRYVTYSFIDKLSVLINRVILVVMLPFLTVFSFLNDINGSGAGLYSQIAYCLPAAIVFGLAASVCLRRKGYSKQGFIAQFAGFSVLALRLVVSIVL